MSKTTPILALSWFPSCTHSLCVCLSLILRVLALRGARVIVAGRDAKKGAETISRLEKEIASKKAAGSVTFFELELTDNASVRAFVAKFLATGWPLHLLINNAGLFFQDKLELTASGQEVLFAANYLGHFLLTALLLHKLKASASSAFPARIVNVSSLAYQFSKVPLDLDDLTYSKQPTWDGMNAYGNTKLMNIFFTKELAERLKGTHVHSVSLHPGLIVTHGYLRKFGNQEDAVKGGAHLGAQLNVPVFTIPQGAASSIYCATSSDPAIFDYNGNFFVDLKNTPLAPIAENPKLQKDLWVLSEKLTQ